MSESGNAPATPRAALRTTLNMGNLVALAISVFALGIGAWQTHLMQSQARASVWPFLTMGYTYSSNTDANGFIWQVDNNGVGPARVETVTLSLDGKPMRHWSDVLATLGAGTSTNFSTTGIAGDVIPPNINRETTIGAIRVNERNVAKRFHDALPRFGMDICYCSVYDECWVAHWQKTRVDAVARCETKGLVQFEE